MKYSSFRIRSYEVVKAAPLGASPSAPVEKVVPKNRRPVDVEVYSLEPGGHCLRRGTT